LFNNFLSSGIIPSAFPLALPSDVSYRLRMSLCNQCHTIQKTCCQAGPGTIPLTPGDYGRIGSHHHDFAELAEPAGYLRIRLANPFDHDIRLLQNFGDARILSIRAHDNGDCHFLSANGCTLAPEIRPLYCRIFPWDFAWGEITGLLFTDCPVSVLEKVHALPELVGVPYHDASAWAASFYQELQEPYPPTVF
jgi:uncharacterized protein